MQVSNTETPLLQTTHVDGQTNLMFPVQDEESRRAVCFVRTLHVLEHRGRGIHHAIVRYSLRAVVRAQSRSGTDARSRSETNRQGHALISEELRVIEGRAWGGGGGGACARAHARILGGRKATDRVGRYPEGGRGGRGGAARSAWRGTAAEGDLSRCSHSGRKGLRSRGWHPAGASEHPNALPTTNQPSGSDRTSQPDRRGPLPHL